MAIGGGFHRTLETFVVTFLQSIVKFNLFLPGHMLCTHMVYKDGSSPHGFMTALLDYLKFLVS